MSLRPEEAFQFPTEPQPWVENILLRSVAPPLLHRRAPAFSATGVILPNSGLSPPRPARPTKDLPSNTKSLPAQKKITKR